MDLTENDAQDRTFDRRTALRRAGLTAGGAVALWSAPALTSLGGAAFAAGSNAPVIGDRPLAGSSASEALGGRFTLRHQRSGRRGCSGHGPLRRSASGSGSNIDGVVVGDTSVPVPNGLHYAHDADRLLQPP